MELIPGIRFDTEQSVLRDGHQGYSLGTSSVFWLCVEGFYVKTCGVAGMFLCEVV